MDMAEPSSRHSALPLSQLDPDSKYTLKKGQIGLRNSDRMLTLTQALASSALVWNMYSLLTPIRYVLNPRFGLETPLQSGLFYIAPGCGYLVGTFVGGRYADYIVKKYINKRGERVPEDRLRSCVFFLGGVIPACMIIYGWSVEKRVGGVSAPLPNLTCCS